MDINWQKSSTKLVVVVSVLIAGLIAWRFYTIFFGSGMAGSQGRASGTSRKVAVDITRMDSLEFRYEIVGNVESSQTADIVARTSGLLLEVTTLQGDQVKKGELLAKIDDAQANAAFYKTKSDLANARFTYYQLLSQQDLTNVQARSGVDIAEANLSAADAEVNKSQAVYQATLSQGTSSVAQSRSNYEGTKAQLRQAEVDFAQAKVHYERMLGLQRQGFSSAADVQDAYAEVLSSHAALEARKAEVTAAETAVVNSEQQARKDNVSAEADIKAARYNAASAQATLKEAVAGTSRSESFQQQLRAQQSLVEAAEAELESARLRIEDTTLRSPVDGFVSDRRLDPGTLVNVGDIIMTVQAGGEVWVLASLPQEVYNFVERDMSCQVKIDGLRDRLFQGYIYRKDAAIDTTSRQFSIRVKLNDPEGEVKPGMFARVLLTLGPKGKQLVVPTSALYERNDVERRAKVNRVVDNKVEIVDVELGPSDAEKTMVRKGLAEGDTVVVQTARPLRDGQSVETEMIGSTVKAEKTPPAITPTPAAGGAGR